MDWQRIQDLRHSLGIRQKQDIQRVAQRLGSSAPLLGDDCAAIPDGDGYLLLAAEGMWPTLVDTDPWFAGWCAVMVNVSDIYAMGGRPLALVDVIWSGCLDSQTELWAGMQAAAAAYQVPILGGHTNAQSPYQALAVAILGRASHLISSFAAQPGDRLLLAVDLQGQRHPLYGFWNAATQADPGELRQKLNLLPTLAEQGLCHAGKDISMGGILGTTLMLLETSRCGALLDLDQIPFPVDFALEEWLTCFPSFGFLLSVAPVSVAEVKDLFQTHKIWCGEIGSLTADGQLHLRSGAESLLFWDLGQDPLTGWGGTH
jgi:hypothetical protein